MTDNRDAYVPHAATRTRAANGEGTASPPTTGKTLDRPIMDGASEYYGDHAKRHNLREGVPGETDVTDADEEAGGSDASDVNDGTDGSDEADADGNDRAVESDRNDQSDQSDQSDAT